MRKLGIVQTPDMRSEEDEVRRKVVIRMSVSRSPGSYLCVNSSSCPLQIVDAVETALSQVGDCAWSCMMGRYLTYVSTAVD